MLKTESKTVYRTPTLCASSSLEFIDCPTKLFNYSPPICKGTDLTSEQEKTVEKAKVQNKEDKQALPLVDVPKLELNPAAFGVFVTDAKIEGLNLLTPSLIANEKLLPLSPSNSTIITFEGLSERIINLENALSSLEKATIYTNNTDSFSAAITSIEESKSGFERKQLELLKGNQTDLGYYEKAVKDFEELINKPNVEEPELQTYFEHNPILLDRGLKQVFAKKSFGAKRFLIL